METPLLGGPEGNVVNEIDRQRMRVINGSAKFERYLLKVKTRKWFIISFWTILTALGFVYASTFTKLGTDHLQPPASSKAAQAVADFQQRFELQAQQVPLIVLVECRPQSNCTDVRQPELKEFHQALVDRAEEYNETHYNVIDIMGYYGFEGTLLDNLKSGFVSNSGDVMFITVMVRTSNETSARRHFVNYLDEVVDMLNPNPGQYDIGLTGFDALNNENTGASSKQIARVDMVTIPLAILVLWYMVGSWRLLLLATITMVISILSGMVTIVFFIEGLGAPQPEPTTTQLVQVISLALSVDYNLFLLGRFQTEVKQGVSPPLAIYIAMHRAGHVVLMSGVTIFLVMLGFVIIPTPTIRMDGVILSTGIACCIAVNLSLVPAALYAWPGFFAQNGVHCRTGAPVYQQADELSEISMGYAPLESSSQVHTLEGVHPMYRGFRFKLTKLIVRWPYNLIVIIGLYALVVPLAIQVARIDMNQNILHLLPRGSQSGARLSRMFDDFPGGTFAPYYILMTVPKGESVVREDTFSLAQHISQRIVDETSCTSSGVMSPASVGGLHIGPLEATGFLTLAHSPFCHLGFVREHMAWACRRAVEYSYLWSKAVNPSQDALLIDITVPFFPFDAHSRSFISHINKMLEEEVFRIAPTKVELSLNGFEVLPNAIESEVLSIYPLLVTLTLLAVFITLGVMLHSYFVPVRLLLTLFLPLASVFGFAVLVYQDGILKWTGIASLSPANGFLWSIPIMIVTMISGLALDYDVLLISAIVEHRAGGYDIQAAIVKAVCETGSTITAAGIIMFCAFGGLLLSTQNVINQAGFLLSTSILVDTFVVNTLLVPALISMGDKFAWQPMEMPYDRLVSLRANEFPQDETPENYNDAY